MLNKPKLILQFKGISVFELGDKFVNLKIAGDEVYSIEDISHLTETILKYYNFTPFVCLTDFTCYFGNFTTEVRQYLANNKDLSKYKYQEAFIIQKLGMRMQANFYFRLFSSLRIKVFRNEEEAVAWLLEKRKEI